ncbi:MAG: hypothetical protein DMD81_11085 [Candidatus Rokuibacteriota bacterium]|nr:MAG: hypothetical protein DMD81_11085 [Candidatus Rokubacteria bacterium]
MLGLILLVQTLHVVIGGPPTSPEYLPVRAAEMEGYFTREGLSVDVHSTRAESGAAEALAQGQADIAATSFEAMLRFGQRPGGPTAKLIFGLTAAPPVALLVHASHAERIRSPRDLAGTRIGLTSTGAPEQAWLMAILARAHVNPAQVDLRSFGARGVAAALDAEEIHAGFVPEPAATQLVGDGRARLLVGLTSPRAVAEAVGGPTVNAGVFVRADRRPGDRELSAFLRAVLAAERLLATEPAAALAARWPQPVVGVGDVFERRLETTRSIYLRDGWVSTDAVLHTVEIVRAHLPLPSTVRVPPPQQLLFLEPLKHAR